MFRCTARGLCEMLVRRVLPYVPDQDIIPLANLSRELPDDLLEVIADEHGSVKEFLRQFPSTFTVKPVGPKNLLTVCRASYVAPDTVTLREPEKKKGSKGAFESPAGIPMDIIDKMEKALQGKASHGVSALYGSLTSSDRRELRKYGGILPVLRHFPGRFTLSPLGLLVARKSEAATLEDEKSLEVTEEEEEYAEAACTSRREYKPEDLQYHAMFFLKYMPLNWTIAPEIPVLVPNDVREKHTVSTWPIMMRQLEDFIETKSGVGCKHLIKRLKRGINIPDIGIIRDDAEMEALQLAHLGFVTIHKMNWENALTWRTLYLQVEREASMKLSRDEFAQACIRYLEPYVVMLSQKQMFRALPPIEIKRTPLWFQALKNCVPKHYTHFRIIKKRLTRGALKEAEKAGGLLEWFRQRKDVFELTLPYARIVKPVKAASKKAPVSPDADLEERLAVRRRNASYIIVTEDQVVEACVSVLPEDTEVRWPLKYLLSLLPIEVIDVIPLDVVPYLLRVCYPRVYIEHNQLGRLYVRRGKERDDGSAGEPFIGSFVEDLPEQKTGTEEKAN